MAKSRVKIEGKIHGDFNLKEGEVASGQTIYPGMVLEVTGTNTDGDPTVQPYSTDDAADVVPRIALTPENPPRGEDADEPREHEFDAGENVRWIVPENGDVIQNGLLASGVNLSTSANANVSIGDSLVVFSDGSVRTGGTAGHAIAEATEAVDNVDGGGSSGGISAKRLSYEVI